MWFFKGTGGGESGLGLEDFEFELHMMKKVPVPTYSFGIITSQHPHPQNPAHETSTHVLKPSSILIPMPEPRNRYFLSPPLPTPKKVGSIIQSETFSTKMMIPLSHIQSESLQEDIGGPH